MSEEEQLAEALGTAEEDQIRVDIKKIAQVVHAAQLYIRYLNDRKTVPPGYNFYMYLRNSVEDLEQSMGDQIPELPVKGGSDEESK